MSVIWSAVGHFSSKVGPTHNKQVSFSAVLSIQVSLNTGNRQCVPYVHYNAIQLFNPLKPELNSICYLLALLGAHHFLHVTRIRVKLLTFRLLMSYIYIYMKHPFLMFLDHTQRRSTVGRTPLDE